MRRNKILELFGYRYIYNKNTDEVHDVKNLHKNCQFKLMRNCYYISKKTANFILSLSIENKCRWCMKKEI